MTTTAPTSFDVVGIGNPLLDIVIQVPDDFLDQNSIVKGSSSLADSDRINQIYDLSGPGVEMSGGSVANSIAALAALGQQTALTGKIGSDAWGDILRHDLRAQGVKFETMSHPEMPTGCCLCLVSRDSDRTLITHLGACMALGAEDLDPDTIRNSKYLLLEGYLFDQPAAKAAFLRAADIAHSAGSKVALSLSAEWCVQNHRNDFLALVRGHVDVVLGNETEICALYETEDFEQAIRQVQEHCDIAALTRAEKGCVIVSHGKRHVVPAATINPVVDTTGAGDLFAAGFLSGLVRGIELADCGRLGSLCAAEIIGHPGARPLTPLREWVADHGGKALLG